MGVHYVSEIIPRIKLTDTKFLGGHFFDVMLTACYALPSLFCLCPILQDPLQQHNVSSEDHLYDPQDTYYPI